MKTQRAKRGRRRRRQPERRVHKFCLPAKYSPTSYVLCGHEACMVNDWTQNDAEVTCVRCLRRMIETLQDRVEQLT